MYQRLTHAIRPRRHWWTPGLAALLIIACTPSDLFYFPEELAQYLHMTETQEAATATVRQAMQHALIGYYRRTTNISRQLGERLSRTAERTEKEKTWEALRSLVKDMAAFLDEKQADKLRSLPLPRLTRNERMDVMRTVLRQDRFASRTNIEVRPSFDFPPTPSALSKEDLWDAWTLKFGNRGIPGMSRGTRSRSFPLYIHATLMDPILVQAQHGAVTEPSDRYPWYQDQVEVRATITTQFHESYLDLDSWIIFLETDLGDQLELQSIEEVDQPWQEPDSILQILMPEAPSPAMMGGGMGAGGGFGQGGQNRPTVRSDRGNAGFRNVNSTSAKFFFRNGPPGYPFITPATRAVSLVFLRDINDPDRAKGTWRFR